MATAPMKDSYMLERALAAKMKPKWPDITIGPKAGRYTVRDRGNKQDNLLAIIGKARRRGYPSKVIQKRWGSAIPGYHEGADIRRGA